MDAFLALLPKIPEILGYVVSALSALIAVGLMIPGDFPEKQLQGVVDFLSKFSKK